MANRIGFDVVVNGLTVMTETERALAKIKTTAAATSPILDQFGRSTESVRTSSERAVAQVERLGTSSDSLFGKFKNLTSGTMIWDFALTAARASVIGMVASVGALVFSGHAASAALISNVDAIRRVQDASGLGVQAAAALTGAIRLTGTESGVLALGLQAMSNEIDSGGAGLARLGIALRDGHGALKTQGALLLEVQERLAGVGDNATRTALRQQLFGRSSGEMAEFLGKSRAEMVQLLATSERLNPVTGEMVRRAEDLKKAEAEADLALQGLKNTVAEKAIPSQIRYNEVLAETYGLLTKLANTKAPEWMTWAYKTTQDLGRSLFGGFTPEQLREAEEVFRRSRGITPPITRLDDPLEGSPTSQGKFTAAPSPTEQAVALARIQQTAQQRIAAINLVEQRTLAALALEGARRTEMLASNQISEREFTEAEIGDSQRRLSAELTAIEGRRAAEVTAISGRQAQLGASGAGGDNPAVQKELIDLVGQRRAAESAAALATVASQSKADQAIAAGKARLAQIEVEEFNRRQQLYAADADSRTNVDRAGLESARSITRERLQLEGSTEEAFIAQVRAEAQDRGAALAKELNDEEGLTQAFADRSAEIRQNADLKIANFHRDRGIEQVNNFVEWQDQLRGVATDGASAIEDAYDKLLKPPGGAIPVAVQTGALTWEQGEAAKVNATRDKTLALSAIVEQGIQKNAELYARDVTNYDSAENKKLRQAAASLARETAMREQLINDEIALRVKALAGINQDAAKRLAIEAGTVEGVLAARQKVIDQVNSLNTFQERFFQQSLEGWAADARAAGDYSSFFAAQLTIALTKGTGFYDSLVKLSQDGAQAMQRALSDLFLDVIEKKFDNLKDIWAGLLGSLKRSTADFFANLATHEIGQILGTIFGIGQGGTQQLSQAASGTAVVLANQLAPAAFAAAQALASIAAGGGGLTSEGFTSSGAAISGIAGVGAAGSLNSTLGILQTANSVGSKLVTAWNWLGTQWSSVVAGWDSGFGGLAGVWTSLMGNTSGITTVGGSIISVGAEAGGTSTGSLAGSLGAASPALSAFTVATAAITIALTAMRTDISDASKVWLTSMYGVSAGLIAFGGPIGVVVGIIMAIVTAIIDFSGILVEHSKDWLSFPGRLSETLNKELGVFKGFVKNLGSAEGLGGIAQTIIDYRHAVEGAGVGGFVETTKGLGMFTVPGIPGATGNKDHEGGLEANFNAATVSVQEGINKVLDKVRDTISVKFADLAARVLPASVAEAFKTGMIDTLRQQFEDLVTSPDATPEDAKKFEERMQAVGELIARFAQATIDLRETQATAAAVLPTSPAQGVSAWADLLTQRLIDLAKSGTATDAQMKAVEDDIKALASGVALYQSAVQTAASLTHDQATMTAAAVASIEAQRGAADRAIDDARKAAAGALTGPEMAAAYASLVKAITDRYALEAKLVGDIETSIRSTLETAGAMFLEARGFVAGQAIGQGNVQPMLDLVDALTAVAQTAVSPTLRMWALSQAMKAVDASIQGVVQAGLVQSPQQLVTGVVAAVAPAIGELKRMFDDAMALNDTEGALAVLKQGKDLILETYNALIAGVRQWEEAQLSAYRKALDVLKTYGDQLVSAGTGWATRLLELGDLSGIRTSLTWLQNLADGAQSLAVKAFAATSAIAMLTAAIPASIEGGLVPLGSNASPAQLTQAVYGGLQGPMGTLTDIYQQQRAAGDWEAALQTLATAAQLANQVGQALIDGIKDWESRAVTAAEATGAAREKDIQDLADAQTKINDTQLKSLHTQHDLAEKTAQVSKDWLKVIDSAQKTIDDLLTGNNSPLNPKQALAYAESRLSIAEAAFARNGTPDNAADVVEAIQRVLSAGQSALTRPSPAYQHLADAMVAKLQALQGIAKDFVTPEESSAASLKSIDTDIDRLTKANEDIRDKAADQIKTVREGTASTVAEIHAAAAAQIAVVKGDLAGVLKTIATEQAGILLQFGPEIDAAAHTSEKAIRDAATGTIQAINAAMTGVMGWVGANTEALMRQQLTQQLTALHAVIGDKSVQEFMALKARETADALYYGGQSVAEILGKILAGIPAHATGIDSTPGGLAILHPREAVLSAQDADWWRELRSDSNADEPVAMFDGESSRKARSARRRGAASEAPVAYAPSEGSGRRGGRGGGPLLVFERGSVVIQGVSDPERAAELAAKKVEARMDKNFRPGGKWFEKVVKGR